MLGLGETRPETEETIRDLRAHGVEILTVGQYLPPDDDHLPLERYAPPGEFAELASFANSLGFRHVESAPLVRSSYHAERAPIPVR
jgi:lipoic acid synthetase